MTEEKTKLRIKLGGSELEYEGGSQFLKDEVMPMITRIIDLVGDRPELKAPAQVIEVIEGAPIQLPSHATAGRLSTTTIAARLKAKGAADLAIAAAAHLTLAANKTQVTRPEILAQMKGASSFYKSTMNNNLTNTLQTLVKAGRLLHVEGETYALAHGERTALEERLAQAH